jgi:ATP-dependent DNA helicase DinG
MKFSRRRFGEAYFALDSALERLETAIDVYAEKMTEAESLVRRVRQTRFDLDFVCSQAEKNYVYWLERRGRGMFLRASPIDVSQLLQEKLFDKLETVVMTSATLSSNGKFDFIKDRLGFGHDENRHDARAVVFRLSKAGDNLLCRRRCPNRARRNSTKSPAGEIIKLLNVTNGRAFVLSTSLSAMNALYELVSMRVNFPCLVQGSMSKAGLLERFRKTPNAGFICDSSFWQGVDVQGEQLSCVIIDKLPFAVPTDPIVAARTRFIDDNGGKSFFDYSVPNAVITLKAGNRAT